MTGKVAYRIYPWLGEECIKGIDEETDMGIIRNVTDALQFANDYCTPCLEEGVIPSEVVKHIISMVKEGRIA